MVELILRQTGSGFHLTLISDLETHSVGFLHGFFEDSLPDSLLRNNSIDDLATALTLHDGHDRIAEEEGPVEVKEEEALPLVERKNIDGSAGVGNDGTASDSIDQNINAAICRHSLLHHPCHVGRLQRIGHQGIGCAASAAYPVHNLLNSCLVEVHPHHGAPFSPDHLRSGPSYTTSSSR